MGDFSSHEFWSSQLGQGSLEEEFVECSRDSFLEQYIMEPMRSKLSKIWSCHDAMCPVRMEGSVYHLFVVLAPEVTRGAPAKQRLSPSPSAICSPVCLPPQRCQAPNQCTCPPGLTGPQCTIDVNECVTGTARCQHGCINTPGSFRCTCHSGYRLANNGRSCIAICDKPCRNLGMCLIPNHCSCFPWFSGAACEVVRRR
ncbi:epidermal growth factor-like protein 8 [Chiloscyllium punctatum]|uniref:epidermal growth factor-like protein 8 n=1 Tax=Chiloscyllium punctatum TaxID=137246 RepID=UPI003B631C8E